MPHILKPAPSPRSVYLRWAERVLLAVGLLCLSLFAYATLDAKWFQYRQERALNQALESRSGAATSSSVPAPTTPAASQADRLDTFQPGFAETSSTVDEGSLLGRIEIERLGISSLVLEGVEDSTLRHGVGHIPNTAMPETVGNIGLAAHRDTIFRGLKDVRKGDRITVESLRGTSIYSVDWTRIVKPDEVSVLAGTDRPELTLVTCYPFYYIGSAPERFIVRAHRLDGGASPAPATAPGK